MPKPPYRRVLLKLSGEILMEGQSFGINPQACQTLAKGVKAFHDNEIETGIVIGGGNIFRGKHLLPLGIARSPADQMGMLATLINGVALQESLENIGCQTKVFSAIECPKVVEMYTWHAAMHSLASGFVTIFVGGTGNPYFTTDTAAALRASEIHADVLLKATKVDGVYSADPIKNPGATKYDSLSYSQMLAEKLEVMDATAVALCRSNKIPIFVFNMEKLKTASPVDLLSQKRLGTLISGE